MIMASKDISENNHVKVEGDVCENKTFSKLVNEKKIEKQLSNEDDIDEADMAKQRSVEVKRLLSEMPLNEDTTCGYWIFKGPFLQRFATKNVYAFLFGFVGCIFGMTYAYFSGTITTIEKRFKIPSRNTGIISVGYDISQLFVSSWLSYYAGKGHKPRWIGIGLLTILVFCILTALPHFLYGPGEDAMALTLEFGAIADENATMETHLVNRAKVMCTDIKGGCQVSEGNIAPQAILFLAQIISGIGGSLYFSLGSIYMDDNTPKAQTPILLSFSYFLRMLGPGIGYGLASFCLKYYIAPYLSPVITPEDPRWMGAWWLGWLIFAGFISLGGFLFSLFPKELPKTAARRSYDVERKKVRLNIESFENDSDQQFEKASMEDMKATFLRLIKNPTFMHNNYASIFYIFGYMPYWIFTAKYIEIQYRQSAATSSLVTGTVALAFSAIGILLAGLVLSKFKPRARYMAGWNVIVEVLTVIGLLSYAIIGCPDNESSLIVNIPENNSVTCNSACNCEYVPYAPVCADNGYTFISACHAGCKSMTIKDGHKIYYDCSCVAETKNLTAVEKSLHQLASSRNYSETLLNAITTPVPERITRETSYEPLTLNTVKELPYLNWAIPGACPVNCNKQFIIFLAVMCALKFIGATGRATNFLISIRCVNEKDKVASLGLNLALISLFAFIPSPIFFGWVMDKVCLVWGKTCTHEGNCWLYDTESLRQIMSILAASFIFLGAIFDILVVYYVKDLKVFDDDINEAEIRTDRAEVIRNEEET